MTEPTEHPLTAQASDNHKMQAIKKFPRPWQLEKWLQNPMLFLSFVWLCVLIFELVQGTTQAFSQIGTGLWVLFVLYFLLRLLTAQNRFSLLKKNWVFILAMAFTVLRFFPKLQSIILVRSLTVALGIQVIWIFASADQGLRFVRRALGRRGAGYVLVVTSVVLLAGAAAVFHFEFESTDPGRMQTFSGAIWWTAMQMTNIGSSYSLRTDGGIVFGLLISIYSAGMFGYLTALFAALIIDLDIKTPKPDNSQQKQLQEIQNEIAELKIILKKLDIGASSSHSPLTRVQTQSPPI